MSRFVKIMMCALLFIGSTALSKGSEQMDYSNVYFVILAGGTGERLWPLSRVAKPKQLLSIGGDKTFLEQAIERVACLGIKDNIWVSTTAQHQKNIQQCIGDMVGRIIVEPGSRNTGPAILLSCLEIYNSNPDALIVFLPADPFIPDTRRFVHFLEHAVDFSHEHDRITLLGLRPTYPATGYGYIEFDASIASGDIVPFKVTRFHEKPSLQKAERYLNAGNMLWNISVFCAQAHVFIDEFTRHAPQMVQGVQQYMRGLGSYDDVPSDSIDYALMEKSARVSVLPVDFSWCDVGNVEVFLTLQQQYEPKIDNVISVNATNNLVKVDNKLVALVGVDDLCVVENEGTLLISKRDKAETVKEVVRSLKISGNKQYL